MRLGIFFYVFIVYHGFVWSIDFRKSLNYGDFLSLLKCYKKGKEAWAHAGHVYEHMVWTAKAMERFFDTHSLWVEGIEKKERSFMVLAAFLHDIGKAGDLQFEYVNKPDHPRAGFEYIMGTRPFMIDMVLAAFLHDIGKAGDLQFEYVNKPDHPRAGFEYIMGTRPFMIDKERYFNIKKFLVHLDLDMYEQKTLAVLIGMHQEFGIHILKPLEDRWYALLTRELDPLFKSFMNKLQEYVSEAQYNNGKIDERIVRMAIAICRADIAGMLEITYPCTTFIELQDCKTIYFVKPVAPHWLIEFVGRFVRPRLLDYADQYIT